MRIILSRKGFDSSSGGVPSPIFPDGRMVSLPIPDIHSIIRYQDIKWQEYNVGALVSDLTHGRIQSSCFAHLDPDLNRESLPRKPEWRPLFGQTGSAQGHLLKNYVKFGDIFLFFGLFQEVQYSFGKLEWVSRAPRRHVLWGWLQIETVLKLDESDLSHYAWAKYHAHFNRDSDPNNTIYIAKNSMTLPSNVSTKVPGAGVFLHYSNQLLLTNPESMNPSQWKLPQWFYPRYGKCPLTYHTDSARWQKSGDEVRLRSVARGQEFILDTNDFPEAIDWCRRILESQ